MACMYGTDGNEKEGKKEGGREGRKEGKKESMKEGGKNESKKGRGKARKGGVREIWMERIRAWKDGWTEGRYE